MELQNIGAEVISVKNPRYATHENISIECDVELSIWKGEFHKFMALSNFDTTHGKIIWEGLMSGKYGEIQPYEPDLELETEFEEHVNSLHFKKEKRIALMIEEDYRLGFGNVSEEILREVLAYIRSIHPESDMESLDRPEIFNKYEM